VRPTSGERRHPDVRIHARIAAAEHDAHCLPAWRESVADPLDLAGFKSDGLRLPSGTVEPSKGMLAAGFSAEEALSSLRVSVGMTNTEAEIDAFLVALEREAAALRRFAPVPVSR
jgi:selenocysteine lyase/cysteine desulfurase